MIRPCALLFLLVFFLAAGCAGLWQAEESPSKPVKKETPPPKIKATKPFKDSDPLELADLLYKQKNYNEAAKAYSSLPEEKLGDPRVLNNLRKASEIVAYAHRQISYAVARAQRQQFDQARLHLNNALRKYPEYQAAKDLKRHLRQMEDRQASAPITGHQVPVPVFLVPAPDNSEARYCYYRGLDCFNRGEMDQAELLWQRSLALDPSSHETKNKLKELLTNRGLKNYGSGKLDQAILDWQRALALNPHDKEIKAFLKKAMSVEKRVQTIDKVKAP